MTSSAAPDTIFVSIASYCDPLLDFTVRSAFGQASRPERVVLAIIEQQVPDLRLRVPERWAPQVRSVHLDPLQARGACWARALAMTLYQGERWFLQIDSHTWFEPGWDERLVRWGHACQALNPRCLITTYPNPFRLVNGQPCAELVGRQVLAHVVKPDEVFAQSHPTLMFEAVPVASEQPVYGLHVAGGFLFAPGTVVNALPYDPFLYFHGEEQSFALRAWTHGWDIFHIPGVPLYHHYVPPTGSGRPMHGSPELNAAAGARLRALLWDGGDLGIYGLGTVRSLAEFAAFSGIDYAARHIAPSAYKARFGY